MVDNLKGEVGFATETKEYVLKLDVEAIIELEEYLDLPVLLIAETFKDPEKLRMGFVRDVFRFALKGGGHKLSPATVSKIVGEIGFVEAVSKIGEALQASFPTDDDGADDDDDSGDDTQNPD